MLCITLFLKEHILSAKDNTRQLGYIGTTASLLYVSPSTRCTSIFLSWCVVVEVEDGRNPRHFHKTVVGAAAQQLPL
jgi:hypothetical protein